VGMVGLLERESGVVCGGYGNVYWAPGWDRVDFVELPRKITGRPAFLIARPASPERVGRALLCAGLFLFCWCWVGRAGVGVGWVWEILMLCGGCVFLWGVVCVGCGVWVVVVGPPVVLGRWFGLGGLGAVGGWLGFCWGWSSRGGGG